MTGQLITPATNGVCVGTGCLSAIPTGALVTSGAIDYTTPLTVTTTGATLLVVPLSMNGSTVPTVSDTLSNIWNYATTYNYSTYTISRIAYSYSSSGGALVTGSDTISVNANSYTTGIFFAFSGTLTTSAVLDTSSGVSNYAGGNPIQPGSITPTGGDILVSGATAVNTLTGCAVNSGFSTVVSKLAGNQGSCGAYLLNASNSAINPGWTLSGSSQPYRAVSTIAAFKTSTAVTGPGITPTSTTVNGKALSSNIVLVPSDLTAAPSLSIPTGTATFAVGSNVTSVGCASGYSCNNTRGTLTIVGGTATTGTIATVSFSATLSAAPSCAVTQNGGAAMFSVGNSAPSTAAFNITADISVAAATFNVNYVCQP